MDAKTGLVNMRVNVEGALHQGHCPPGGKMPAEHVQWCAFCRKHESPEDFTEICGIAIFFINSPLQN